MSKSVSKILVACFLIAGALSTVQAQNVRIEKIEIATQSPSTRDFLTGRKNAKAAKITAVLHIPGAAKEKVPAVILVHGSGGVGANIHYWVPQLNQIGVATLVIDSFTGRGVKNTITDQTQVTSFTMVFDAYRALEILAKHPAIDPERIAVMGFSKGGFVALYSSMTRFQEMYLARGVKFAAHIPFYAACNTEFTEDTKVGGVPLRLFHGSADDYTPVGACKDYVARLKSAGADVALAEYPGAHHAFDNPKIVAPRRLAKALTGRKCLLKEASEGAVINKATGQRFSAKDSCIERGTTVAYSAAATAATTKQVAAFLRQVFKPK